jgi:hypothetical protein
MSGLAMTLRARDRLVKLLKMRGLRINDTITTAIDSFLIEVREQQSARSAGIEDDESEEEDDVDEDDDADGDEDLNDDENEKETEDDDDEAGGEKADHVTKGGWDAEDDSSEGSTPKTKTVKGVKKPVSTLEPEGEDAPEEERTLVQEVTCPHCGERIPLILDLSGGDQDDIQDCEVCCSPIRVIYTVQQGALGALSIEAS